jgi:hypothetical protein
MNLIHVTAPHKCLNRLFKRTRTFQVLSKGSRACYIKDTLTETIITLMPAASEVCITPYTWTLSLIPSGIETTIQFHSDSIKYTNISCPVKYLYAPEMPSPPAASSVPKSDSMALVAQWLKKYPEGMGGVFCNRGILASLLLPKLKELYQSFDKTDAPKFFSILADIAGAGPGLTPSSDDFICGLLYAFHSMRYSKTLNDLWSIPAFTLNRNIQKKTTSISANFVRLASLAKCAPWQYTVLHKLTTEIQVEDLESIRYGHTSGADIIAGMAFAFSLPNANLRAVLIP